jgi:hypothetical protein
MPYSFEAIVTTEKRPFTQYRHSITGNRKWSEQLKEVITTDVEIIALREYVVKSSDATKKWRHNFLWLFGRIDKSIRSQNESEITSKLIAYEANTKQL